MTDAPDRLRYLLEQQSALQEKMPSPHPSDIFTELQSWPEDSLQRIAAIGDANDFMQWNDKALVHEMVEMEAETSWKPWAKGAFFNIEAARGEWIDMLHFMLNGALLLGLDADEIIRRYDAKHEKNAKRQEEGYDGVSTKCGVCKRALDDAAVLCREDPLHPGYYICYAGIAK